MVVSMPTMCDLHSEDIQKLDSTIHPSPPQGVFKVGGKLENQIFFQTRNSAIMRINPLFIFIE